MAGGSSEDNPVPINVVPMVDVIFCLCVFFMCSFKFKQLEGAFNSWLPKDKGNQPGQMDELKEIRIAMFWEPETQQVRRQFGQRVVEDDAELTSLIKSAHDDWVLKNNPTVPVIIDGDPRIPWKSVIGVVNISKSLAIDNFEFALGAIEKM